MQTVRKSIAGLAAISLFLMAFFRHSLAIAQRALVYMPQPCAAPQLGDDMYMTSAQLDTSSIADTTTHVPPGLWQRENDPAFSGVVNSVFPIDLVISYNASDSHLGGELIARYASFSPVLRDELHGQYVFVAGSACSDLDASVHPEYTDKILIVARGKCTFSRKLEVIWGADFTPRAVIVANNVPHSGLITMYSKTFNKDALLSFPVLFMTFEDAETLRLIQQQHVELSIRTASFDGFLGLVLLMAVLPPLLILACYLGIRGTQCWSRRRRNARNQQFVKLLPVHIYARGHLVPSPHFYEYLVATNQTSDVPLVLSSTEDVAEVDGDCNDASPFVSGGLPVVLGGTDIHLMPQWHILHAETDFYPTQKCSICLGRFTPLRLRVLVLACKHIYHEKCLSNWLINFRKTCPLCNDKLRISDVSSLISQRPQNYGTFEVDLENANTGVSVMSNDEDLGETRSSYMDNYQCSTANTELAHPTDASEALVTEQEAKSGARSVHDATAINFPNATTTSSRSPGNVSAESYGSGLSGARVSDSESFVTTKTQYSTSMSQVSVPSSYHTSAAIPAEQDTTDTQLHESSRSTLRYS